MGTTQEKIAGTFMKLLEEKSYRKISINAICEATPISRNSFYYHFGSKEEVVSWIVLQHYLKYCLPYFTIREDDVSTKSFFLYIQKYKSFYDAIFRIDRGMLLGKCLREAYDIGLDKEHVVEYASPNMNSKEKVDFRTCLCYCNAGTAAVIISWIEGGMKTPVGEIAHDLSLMMTKSLEEIRDHYLY